jgi:hypothetical protein
MDGNQHQMNKRMEDAEVFHLCITSAFYHNKVADSNMASILTIHLSNRLFQASPE